LKTKFLQKQLAHSQQNTKADLTANKEKKIQNLKKNKKFNTNKKIQSSPQAQIADFKTQTLNLVFFFVVDFFRYVT